MTVLQVDLPGIDAVRADGGLVRIRPPAGTDADGMRELFARASDQSIYLRFFSASRESITKYLQALLRPADDRHRVLVACVCGQIAGVAEYERLPARPGEAEVALFVADNRHHEGIGTLLLEHLAAAARAEGVNHFVADVLAANTPVMTVLRDLGYTLTARSAAGTVRVRLDLEPCAPLIRAIEDRERKADAASLRTLLAPRSIAVVGASIRPGAVGHQVLRNILDGGFTGTVHPVNPRHEYVLGLPSVPRVTDLPAAPDLAVIAVPAERVSAVVSDCGQRGVHGLLVLTAGFGETGQEGRERQAEVLEIARRYGMRLIGPNCLGLLNSDPSVRLNATFAPLPVQAGGLGLVSQSGALGIAVLAGAARTGLGIAQFISVGNKADVSSNDLLLAWERDDRVRVIALYLESFGNPRKFARIARRVAGRKPVIAIKAGRSAAGRRAGQSHTAAAAASDVVVDALFTQAGVLRVGTMEQMLDAARVLDDQPLPAGARLAIVGNSGGPGILAADAADGAGLTVVELAAETEKALRADAPAAASYRNPVDLSAAVGADQLAAAVRTLLAAPEVDAVLVVYTGIATVDAEDVLRAVAATAVAVDKPVLVARVGAAPGLLTVPNSPRTVPVFGFPEPAAAAISTAWRYAQIRRSAPSAAARPADIDAARAHRMVAAALAAGTRWLGAEDTARLLGAYRLPVSAQRVISGLDEAFAAATELGYPVAVKLADGGQHKTDIGGVRLGIDDAAALHRAVTELIAAHPRARLLVQPMAPDGIEMIVGAMQHAQFGPLVMVGAGGVLTDLASDRSFRLAPIGLPEAEAMLGELRFRRLLDGYRGRPGVSRTALADVIVRVSTLADDLPEVTELDLNPVICAADELTIVDARLRITQPATTPDPLLRRLH